MDSKNYLLLMMGGSGTRLGANIPKQYISVGGKPIFSYVLEKYQRLDYIDGIVIVSNKNWIDFVNENISNEKIIGVVSGGDSRSESVLNGLLCLKDIANDNDNILVHDSTHPHLDIPSLEKAIEKLKEYQAVTLATSVYDTCYRRNEKNEIDIIQDRKLIAVGASPECFKFGILKSIFFGASKEELEKMTSVGAFVQNCGYQIAIIDSDLLNLKITYPGDLELFKLLYDNYYK